MSLESLSRQQETATSLLSLVKTMKALAGVSVRNYQVAAESVDSYAETLERGLQIVLSGTRLTIPPKGGKALKAVIVVGTDQGMCGPFNETIATLVTSIEEPPNACLVVGSRLLGSLKQAGWDPGEALPLPSSVAGIGGIVVTLLEQIDRWRADKVAVVELYSNLFTGAHYRPVGQRLWPLDPVWLSSLASRPWPSRCLPTWAGGRSECLSSLFRQWLFVGLYRCIANSLAAEQTARLTSMQAAEKNISERLEELQRRFHAKRQEAITSELLDIVSGFESLTSKDI